jgi:hypothetical protein
MQFAFGSGSMWGVDSGANPTPGKFGILQDVSVDFPFSNKPLFGSYQSPVAIGRGTAKPAWKAKFAQLSGRVFNSLFFGQTKASGQVSVAEDELGTIAAGAVTVANGANFVDDLGVRYSATGLPLVRVAAAPAVGQYVAGAAGVGSYAFNVAENGVVLKFDYTYTIAGSGEKITIANQLLGSAPTFKAVFTQLFNAKRQTLVLNANVANKIGVASKLEDFVMPEFDADITADSGNNIGTWSLGEAS